MKPPRLPVDHPDRILELEEQMEADIAAAADKALAAGYDVGEIEAAVRSLIANYAKRLAANEDTDRQIAEALARRNLH